MVCVCGKGGYTLTKQETEKLRKDENCAMTQISIHYSLYVRSMENKINFTVE